MHTPLFSDRFAAVRPQRILTCLAIGMLTTVIGCDDTTPTATTDASSTAASASAKPEPKPDEPEYADLELLDKGKAPHTALRYAPKANQKEVLEVARTSIEGEIKGKKRPVPKGTVKLSFTVKSIKDGKMNCDVDVVSFVMPKSDAIPASQHEAVNEKLQTLTKLAGSVTFDDRGRGTDAKLNVDVVDKDLLAVAKELEAGMVHYLARLPNGRVGVGAKWKVKQDMSAMMVKGDSTTTYTLVSVEDGKYVLSAETKTTAKDEVIEFVPGQPLDLLKLEGVTTAKFTLSLDRRLPVTAESSDVSEMDLKGKGRPKKTVKVTSTAKMSSTVE